MRRILKIAKAPWEYVEAVDLMKCETCDLTEPQTPANKSAMPPCEYVFNHTTGVDVLYLHDAEGNEFMFLNIVCMGTSFQIVAYLRQGGGSPSSRECLNAFQTAWQSWATWPAFLVSDLGLHNRGIFARTLSMNGTMHDPIALESPERLAEWNERADHGSPSLLVSSQDVVWWEKRLSLIHI